jgi:anaerobic selenocysteine-containing dehydrogenase
MIEKMKTICPLDCPDTCGLIASVEEGKIIKLEGDPDHDFTRGFLCRKMRIYHERVHSKDRILYPMIRTGKKGEGQFKRIDWDEAWQMLTDNLTRIKEAYGGEALLPYSYAGNMGLVNRAAGYPLFHRFGASRLDKTICSSTASAGWKAHMGSRTGTNPLEAANSKLVVAWGINVKSTNIHFWPMIQKCRKNGGKLVVIDPYRNITAKGADLHLQVKPGGDVALALGALKSIIENDKQDEHFIKTQTSGFDLLKDYVSELSWKKIETTSGISQSEIQQFSNLLAENPETFIRIGMGLTRNSSGATSVRSITCLCLALGLFDNQPGKGVLLSAGAFSGNKNKLEYESLAKCKTRLINMVQLGQALTSLSPPVHGLFVYNSNPLSIAPDSSSVRKGLEREDLFTVVHEQVMTPTARYADLLLPATTVMENTDLFTAYGHFNLGIVRPVIAAPGEAMDNFTLFQTLAQKMGYEDAPFQQTIQERMDDYLEDLKGLPDDFRKENLSPGVYVKSVRHSLEDDDALQAKYNFAPDDLPQNTSSIPNLLPTREFEDPDLLSRFPLKLITPPNGDLLNSTFGERYLGTPATIIIHPKDAQARYIKNGDPVKISNFRGSTFRKARVCEDTQKGLVVAEGVYWENTQDHSNGINDLTSQKTADLGEGGTFHESLVEIEIKSE